MKFQAIKSIVND